MSETEKWKHACVLMSLAVIGLLVAIGVMARHPPVIVIAPKTCPQVASRAVWPQHYVIGRHVYRV